MSEHYYSEVIKDIFRLDSEPFQKINQENFSDFETVKLSEIALANPPKSEISDLKINLSVSFIPMEMLGNGLINKKEEGKVADFINAGYSYFTENDILVAKITPCMEHGKCAIAKDLMNGIGFGSTEYNVFRIKDNRILTEYLFAYLNRDIIKKQAENNMIGTSGRQRVPISFYENLQIPIVDIIFQKKLKKKYDDAHSRREQSQILYRQAEELLLETIGLKDFTPSQEKVSIKTFKESFWKTGRLDAEYYQLKYEKIENKIKQYKTGFSYIGEHFEQNKQIIDCSEKQYNYIEIGDINVGDGSHSFNMVDAAELPANAKIKSNRGDLLISKVRPNRGAVSIIDENIHNLVVSGAFTVLKENSNYKKEVLFILLRTIHYKEWLLKYNVGTSYPVIKDEDVLTLPIPLIDERVQLEIADLIEKSFSFRRKSEKLLREAKEMVEKEITDSNV